MSLLGVVRIVAKFGRECRNLIPNLRRRLFFCRALPLERPISLGPVRADIGETADLRDVEQIAAVSRHKTLAVAHVVERKSRQAQVERAAFAAVNFIGRCRIDDRGADFTFVPSHYTHSPTDPPAA